MCDTAASGFGGKLAFVAVQIVGMEHSGVEVEVEGCWFVVDAVECHTDQKETALSAGIVQDAVGERLHCKLTDIHC